MNDLEENMKTTITDDSLQHIFAILDDLIRVDHVKAQSILAEIESYLDNADFTEYWISQINILIGIARYHINGRDATKAHKVLMRALKLAEDNNSPEEIFHVQSTLAIIHSMRGDHLKAIYLWEQMLTQINQDHSMWMPIINNLVVAFSYTKQFTRAVDLSFKLLRYMEGNDVKPEEKASALINLGNSYTPLKNHDKALTSYEAALRIAKKIDNLPYQSYIHGNMARTYADLKNYPKAYEHSLEALKISETFYGESQIADSLISLGSICIKMNRFEEAEQLLSRGLSLLDIENDRVGYTNALLTSATLHLELKHMDEALRELQAAEALCGETDVLQHRINLLKLYGEYYSRAEDYQKANEFLRKMAEIQDEMYEDLSEKMISQEEAEYLRYKIDQQNTILLSNNRDLERSNRLIKSQSRQLEKTNRELNASLSIMNRLISIISHDVRGPAANSAAALRMIVDGSISSAASNEMIGHVITNLDEVTDLLAEIMVWIESRSFQRDVTRLLKVVKVENLIQTVLKFFRGSIGQKNILVKLDIQPEMMVCHTEPNILKIVLRNIISNAIKFTPDKGTIFITCREQDDSILMKIVDTGVGMSAMEIKALKKKRVKAKTGTNQEVGLGIGLSLSLAYLKPLGISYDIQSEINQGTAFSLTIPK